MTSSIKKQELNLVFFKENGIMAIDLLGNKPNVISTIPWKQITVQRIKNVILLLK